jgi:hypothetical protein
MLFLLFSFSFLFSLLSFSNPRLTHNKIHESAKEPDSIGILLCVGRGLSFFLFLLYLLLFLLSPTSGFVIQTMLEKVRDEKKKIRKGKKKESKEK